MDGDISFCLEQVRYLLKAVVQSLPTYVMSVFLLPRILFDELERMMNSFWWGKGDMSISVLRWKNCSKLSLSKHSGGLGFRRIHEYNIALLAKQSWRLVSDPHSLVSKVLKSRYYPRGNFFNAKI